MKKAKRMFMSFKPMTDAREDVLIERESQIKKLEKETDYIDEVDELFENPLNFTSRKYYSRHFKSHRVKLLLSALMIIFICLVFYTMYINDIEEFGFWYPILVGIVVSVATMVSGYSDFEKEEYNYYYVAYIEIIEKHTKIRKVKEGLANNLSTTLVSEQEVASTVKDDNN